MNSSPALTPDCGQLGRVTLKSGAYWYVTDFVSILLLPALVSASADPVIVSVFWSVCPAGALSFTRRHTVIASDALFDSVDGSHVRVFWLMLNGMLDGASWLTNDVLIGSVSVMMTLVASPKLSPNR